MLVRPRATLVELGRFVKYEERTQRFSAAEPQRAGRCRVRFDATRYRDHVYGVVQLPAGAGTASRAAYGIAPTGSVVLASLTDEFRSRPSATGRARVTPTRRYNSAHLASVLTAFAGQLSSALAIVTRPSRSAEIEQKLVVGVHEPGEVHVVLERA